MPGVDTTGVGAPASAVLLSAEAEGLQERSLYYYAMGIAQGFVPKEDYTVSTGVRSVDLTDRGRSRIRDYAWADEGLLITEKQQEELVRQALVALHLFSKDKHYLIRDGKIQIVDEYTGRIMEERSWERGLHQLIEIKEGCEVTKRKETKARISYQRFLARTYVGELMGKAFDKLGSSAEFTRFLGVVNRVVTSYEEVGDRPVTLFDRYFVSSRC